MVNYDNRTLGRFPGRKHLVTEGIEDTPTQPAPLLYLMDATGHIHAANKSGFGWGGSGNYAYSITSPYADVPIQSNPVGYAYASIVSVWVSRCIEIRSQAVTRIPRYVVNRKTKDIIPGHPFEVAIKRAHKYGQNIYSLWERSKLIFGEVYLWPMTNDYHFVTDIQWLNNLGTNPIIAAGYISGYTYVPVNGGKMHNFDYEDIAFYKTENLFNDLRGLSPLDTILLEIGIDKDVSRVTKAWYANDSRPGLILIPEADVGTEAGKEFMDYWKENLQGAKNAGKPIMMPRAIKEIKEFNRAPSPDDVNIRESMRREICARFGVPLSVAGAWDDAQYQSAPEQRRSLYEETIIPECEELDAWLTNAVLPFFDDSGSCEVISDLTDIKALIEDESTKASISTQRLMSGGILLNEYRQAQGLPEDPNGNVYFVPSGVIVTPQANIGTPTPPPQAPQGFGGFQPLAQQSLVQKPPVIEPPQALAKKSDEVSDELAAWKKKAMNGGAIKALSFVCYHLPKAVESEIRGSLRADMDKTALKAVFDHAAMHLKEVSSNPFLVGKSTTIETSVIEMPEKTVGNAIENKQDAFDYWKDYDALQSEIGQSWLNEYMANALALIDERLHETDALSVPELQALLTTLHDKIVSDWAGTAENPGALTRIILAGSAAGDASIQYDSAANPNRPVTLKANLLIDWALLPKEAIEFVKRYGFELIRRLDVTTQDTVRKAIEEWLQSGKPLDALRKVISAIFHDDTRAQAISATESTRAYYEGTRQRYQSAGVQEGIWNTVNVGLKRAVKLPGDVCPICSPLHLQQFDLNQGAWSDVLGKYVHPPSHVNCRCWVRAVIPDV